MNKSKFEKEIERRLTDKDWEDDICKRVNCAIINKKKVLRISLLISLSLLTVLSLLVSNKRTRETIIAAITSKKDLQQSKAYRNFESSQSAGQYTLRHFIVPVSITW